MRALPRLRPLFTARGRKTGRSRPRTLEFLEERNLLSTFTVSSLADAGPGSLRAALIAANAHPGADTVDFAVAGTVAVGRTPLPAVTGPVTLDGSTAPGFAGRPVVTLDFRGTAGLRLNRGADGSTVRSLSLVGASGAGLTLNASRVTVEGNDIGLRAGTGAAAGNRGDGILITAGSSGNVIGHVDPVTGLDAYNADGVPDQPVTAWQGIRNADAPGQYLITGTSGANGLLYVGPISGVGGTSYLVNYPGATTTSVYGPDTLGGGALRLVGSYKDGNGVVHGFVFQGTLADLNTASHFVTLDGPSAQITYVHSTMGDLAVGNTDGPEGVFPIVSGHAFLYDLKTSTFLPGLSYPGATTTTAYGIWSNGLGRYTIAGGYSDLGPGGVTKSHGYLVDYEVATGRFTNWTSFDDPAGTATKDVITHFEGISSVEKGVYTLAANSFVLGESDPFQASLVSVRRNPDGTFAPGVWTGTNYPGAGGFTTADSVAGNQMVGIVASSSGGFSYQITVNTGFQLSNVISANGGNGITIDGSSGNVVSMNNIGTDASGTVALGNRGNGILVTHGASRNLIGGQATGGNDPTGHVFVRPPQGNLISGNAANGVLLNAGARQNILSGNFVGTAADGNAPLGNRLDGVAIDHASGNSLIGCTFRQNPFVFYNVLSGNGRNGLRVTDSNDTTVQANFIGVGANNATVVANHGDGLLVSGSSRNTQVGGVIPLGNVISGNDLNGIEVSGRASGFVSFNTFAGLFAFSTAAPNGRNGILVTSTGGNNLIRTSIVSGNRGNGIEIGGNATGVQVTDTATGTDTNLTAALPNGGSGIVFSGHAHGNAVGGYQPSIEPSVTASSNGRYGIEVVGAAHDNLIAHTLIGTTGLGLNPLGNTLGGIYLGRGTSGTRIGGLSSSFANLIRFNGGNGITLVSARRTTVLGNTVAQNTADGLRAMGLCCGSVVARNTITGNGGQNVNLTGSRGVHYIP